jgi:predicted nucleic acid-binding Zn ribbon protein
MKRLSPQEQMRRQVRREWHGVDEALDLNANVHRAADFVAEIVRLAGLADGMEEQRLQEIWSELAGEFIAKGSVPVSLKRGCLTIRVTQPSMRFHLEQMRGSLLAKIQQAAGNDKIQSLRISVG